MVRHLLTRSVSGLARRQVGTQVGAELFHKRSKVAGTVLVMGCALPGPAAPASTRPGLTRPDPIRPTHVRVVGRGGAVADLTDGLSARTM